MKRKPDLLSHLIRSGGWQQVLVFSRTKYGANRVAERLNKEGLPLLRFTATKVKVRERVHSKALNKVMCVFLLQRTLLLAASIFSNYPTL